MDNLYNALEILRCKKRDVENVVVVVVVVEDLMALLSFLVYEAFAFAQSKT